MAGCRCRNCQSRRWYGLSGGCGYQPKGTGGGSLRRRSRRTRSSTRIAAAFAAASRPERGCEYASSCASRTVAASRSAGGAMSEALFFAAPHPAVFGGGGGGPRPCPPAAHAGHPIRAMSRPGLRPSLGLAGRCDTPSGGAPLRHTLGSDLVPALLERGAVPGGGVGAAHPGSVFRGVQETTLPGTGVLLPGVRVVAPRGGSCPCRSAGARSCSSTLPYGREERLAVRRAAVVQVAYSALVVLVLGALRRLRQRVLRWFQRR
jgi:hypothetical protein